MPNWLTTSVGEVAEIFDGPHATPTKTEFGPWFLSISSLDRGRLKLAESAHLSEEDFAKWTRRVTPSAGDLLFSYETRLGDAALMPHEIRACLGRRMGILRPRRDRIDPQFLLYAYLGPKFQQTIQERSIRGATVDRIPLTELGSWPISIPALGEQKAIAEVLRALDDKVAVNDRIATTADKLRELRTLYFFRSNHGRIEERPLSSLAQFTNGRAFTRDATGTGRMVIRIAELNSAPGDSTVYNDIAVPEQHLARPGDVLFAWSGSLTVARWFRSEAIINQHIFKVIPNAPFPSWLLFELIQIKLADFKRIAADKATTMGHIQRRHLDEIVNVPAEGMAAGLDAELGPLWQRALLAEQESLKLAELRDALLPKLMSGEIRVRDAEKLVEDAA